MMDFVGAGSPLTQTDMNNCAATVNVGLAELWSVLSVETSGCGFLADRRPKILFERHIFGRLTNGRFDADDPDVSARTAGGYGPSGAHQYDRLGAAIQLDRAAALQSASWGLGQIMGENFAMAGFADAETMVASMAVSESAQLQAMMNFLKASGLDRSLRRHDWAGFARLYNGPNYAKNNYDGLLQHFYQRYSSAALPDLTVRAAQVYLNYKGFTAGGVDGIVGQNTVKAVKAYQASKELPQTGVIDDQLIAALAA